MKRILSLLIAVIMALQVFTIGVNYAFASQLSAPEVSGYCDLTDTPVVKWKTVKAAKKYFVYRSRKKNGKYKLLASTKLKYYEDKSAKLHKNYYYKVYAGRSKGGKWNYSPLSSAVKIKAMKTVFVGDSVMEGVEAYKALPNGHFVTKIGVGTYSFYNGNRYRYKGRNVTGIDKLIYSKPDRVFLMFGMNELAYASQKNILKYYEYIIEDLQDEFKDIEIILLSVSPTSRNCGKTIPKKPVINKFNKKLKKFAAKHGCEYYDFTAPFKDKNGYLLSKYDGGDGCHWLPSSCKLFIKQINKYVKNN